MTTYLSVCSGLEGASLAVHSLGWTPVGYAEIEAFPSAIIAHHFGSNMPGDPLSGNAPPNFGDFTQIDLGTLGPVDILIGGTPCQAFSIAGKRLSLADARGNLTLAYAVLADELARSHGLRNALWENVPGVLNSADNAFGCFLGQLVGFGDALVPCARPARGKSNAGWTWKPARREPVLDDDGNETGEFIDRPAEHVARWPSAGMASGPRARLAWRLLDAQYFGLAQRRERVFVVVDFGNGADPAAVLFERQGLHGNSPPRREAREETAGALAASTGGSDKNDAADGRLVAAFGGGNSDRIEAATTLTAHGQRLDFETETIVAHALRAEGFDASEDGTGRGKPIVPVAFNWQGGGAQTALGFDPASGVTSTLQAEQVPAICFTAKDYGADAQTDLSPTLRAGGFTTSHANAGVMPAIAFQERGLSDYGVNGVPTIRANGGEAAGGSEALVAEPFAFDLRGREGGAVPEGPHDTANIRAASGGSSRSYVAQAFGIRSDAMRNGVAKTPSADAEGRVRLRDPGFNVLEETAPTLDTGAAHIVGTRWAVRRLTPEECEKLQGVPVGWTRIPRRGKPPEECPDGPRYKALGNSWAIPVVRWICTRIDSALPVTTKDRTRD